MRFVPYLRACGVALAAFGSVVVSAQAQECYVRGDDPAATAQRPSPLGETLITLGGEEAKLCYGRPSANGREIMGGLVPWGQPWRIGANEATALHLPFSAVVGGVELEPGSYSLYAVPGQSEWEIFVNGNAERWGIPINDEVTAENIGSFTRPASATEEPVEELTFWWDSHGADMGHLVMDWQSTRVEIPIQKSGM